jgi:hypothetical protein
VSSNKTPGHPNETPGRQTHLGRTRTKLRRARSQLPGVRQRLSDVRGKLGGVRKKLLGSMTKPPVVRGHPAGTRDPLRGTTRRWFTARLVGWVYQSAFPSNCSMCEPGDSRALGGPRRPQAHRHKPRVQEGLLFRVFRVFRGSNPPPRSSTSHGSHSPTRGSTPPPRPCMPWVHSSAFVEPRNTRNTRKPEATSPRQGMPHRAFRVRTFQG